MHGYKSFLGNHKRDERGMGERALLHKCLNSAELDAEMTRMHDEVEVGTTFGGVRPNGAVVPSDLS